MSVQTPRQLTLHKVLRIAVIVAAMMLAFAIALSKGRTQTPPPPPNNAVMPVSGKELYFAYCASCHGREAKGTGPAASALRVRPPDLTRIAIMNGGRFPTQRVENVISGDDPSLAAHGSREMPVWGPVFGQIAWDQDLGKVRIHNLAKYLESIQEK